MEQISITDTHEVKMEKHLSNITTQLSMIAAEIAIAKQSSNGDTQYLASSISDVASAITSIEDKLSYQNVIV